MNNEEFDEHPSVNYQDLTHLFWGKYPYRVTVMVQGDFKSETHRVQAREAMLNGFNLDGVPHKRRVEGNRASLFFEEPEAARIFIAENASVVVEVVRPRSINDISVMTDRKVRVRPTLFFDRYKWMVKFQTTMFPGACASALACDQWVENFLAISETRRGYGEIEGRALYSYAKTRVLYLNEIADVVAAKIALYDYVTSIEECVLQAGIAPTDEKNPTEASS